MCANLLILCATHTLSDLRGSCWRFHPNIVYVRINAFARAYTSLPYPILPRAHDLAYGELGYIANWVRVHAHMRFWHGLNACVPAWGRLILLEHVLSVVGVTLVCARDNLSCSRLSVRSMRTPHYLRHANRKMAFNIVHDPYANSYSKQWFDPTRVCSFPHSVRIL